MNLNWSPNPTTVGRAASGAHLRARIRHLALTRAPMWLSRGRLGLTPSVQAIHTLHRRVILPKLPAELDGLRIVHLSDLHIGQVLGPQALPRIVETVNDLRGDLIAVTGDFVDLSLGVLDPIITALSHMQAPLGVHLVLGNHDHLENGPELIRRFRHAKLGLLVNQSITITHARRQIVIAGIDFAHRRPGLARLVHRTLIQAREHPQADLRLLLAHHPEAFGPACKHGVDLTLSGHTHGGQLILANTQGKRGSIGLGAMAFRYPRGLYRQGPHYLYVTSGVGSWFPWRMRCPAEIACLTLRQTEA